MTKKETKEVKSLLHNVDKEFVINLLNKVNLSAREKDVITTTEMERTTINELAEKMFVSPDTISYIKKTAIKKIYLYLLQKNYIKTTN